MINRIVKRFRDRVLGKRDAMVDAAIIKIVGKNINPVVRFVAETCELRSDFKTPLMRLYRGYKIWCNNTGSRPVSRYNFANQLLQNFPFLTAMAHDSMLDLVGIRDWEKTPPVRGSLDVEKYLNHYGLQYKVKHRERVVLYLLKECVFNHDHRPYVALISQSSDNSVLHYRCFHASCEGKTWQDARTVISGNDSITRFCEGREI